MKKYEGFLQIILAEFFISVVYILGRFGKSLGNENLSFFRVFFGLLFLLLFSVLLKKQKIQKIQKEKLKLILFGTLHGFIFLAVFLSLNLLSISTAVILQSTMAVWVALFSIVFLKEKLVHKTVLALVFSLFGLVVILDPSLLFVQESKIGILAALFVGISAGFVFVLSKTFKHYNKISLAFWQNLIAVPFLLPFLFFNTPSINLFSLAIFLGLGLFGALSFFFLYAGIGKVKGQSVSALTLLFVVFSIILGFFFFGEIPTLREIIGGFLILLGSYMASKK